MSLFKTSLVYHPPIPAVSLKERQQGAGTELDHRQWVWGRRHWSFRHLHILTAKYRQHSWIHTAPRWDYHIALDAQKLWLQLSGLLQWTKSRSSGLHFLPPPDKWSINESSRLCYLPSFRYREEQLFTAPTTYPNAGISAAVPYLS